MYSWSTDVFALVVCGSDCVACDDVGQAAGHPRQAEEGGGGQAVGGAGLEGGPARPGPHLQCSEQAVRGSQQTSHCTSLRPTLSASTSACIAYIYLFPYSKNH